MVKKKKAVKKTAKRKTTKRVAKGPITIKVGTFGQIPNEISFPGSITLENLVGHLGISTDGQSIWVNGAEKKMTDKLNNGDNVQLIGKKEGSK